MVTARMIVRRRVLVASVMQGTVARTVRRRLARRLQEVVAAVEPAGK